MAGPGPDDILVDDLGWVKGKGRQVGNQLSFCWNMIFRVAES